MFLDLKPGADEKTIKTARNIKARLLHPDLQADAALIASAEEGMKRVNEAHDVLLEQLHRIGNTATAPPQQESAQHTRPGASKPTGPPTPPPPPKGTQATCALCAAVNHVPDDQPSYACSTCASPLFGLACKGCGRNQWVWGVGSWQCSCGRTNQNSDVRLRG